MSEKDILVMLCPREVSQISKTSTCLKEINPNEVTILQSFPHFHKAALLLLSPVFLYLVNTIPIQMSKKKSSPRFTFSLTSQYVGCCTAYITLYMLENPGSLITMDTFRPLYQS